MKEAFVIYFLILLNLMESQIIPDYTQNELSQYIEDKNICEKTESHECNIANKEMTSNSQLFKSQCCYFKYKTSNKFIDELKDNFKDYLSDTSLDLGKTSEYTEECFTLSQHSEYRNYLLYSTSIYSEDNKVIYNCNDGEVTFDGSTYNPTSSEGKTNKDFAQCSGIFNKDKCLTKAKEFSTDVSCCWISANDLLNENNINSNDLGGINFDGLGICSGYIEKYTEKNIELMLKTNEDFMNSINNMLTLETIPIQCADKKGNLKNLTYDYKEKKFIKKSNFSFFFSSKTILISSAIYLLLVL